MRIQHDCSLQMVMFTLAKPLIPLKLNNPYNICIIYLGFGAGLAVFMFTGFVKSMPIAAIEEARYDRRLQSHPDFLQVVCPILKPTMISTAILETMWVWNDYLLPTLVLDIKTFRTIPMAIQYFRGSYGKVEMAPMMACIMITVLPVIVLYLICQKYIIDGVVAGAVKGVNLTLLQERGLANDHQRHRAGVRLCGRDRLAGLK